VQNQQGHKGRISVSLTENPNPFSILVFKKPTRAGGIMKSAVNLHIVAMVALVEFRAAKGVLAQSFGKTGAMILCFNE